MARKKHQVLLKIEKRFIRISTAMSLILVIASVFFQASLSKTNIEVERLKIEIKTQASKNMSLVMKKNELASLENIQTVAKEMGLAYNNDNIRTISR